MNAKDPYDESSPFDEMEHIRRKRLLIAITTGTVPAVIPVILIFGFMLITQFTWQIALVFCMSLLIVPLSLVVRIMAKTGRGTAGSYVFIPVLLVILGTNALLLDGLLTVIAPLYIILIIMGGMLLGPTGGYTNAIIAAGLWLAAWIISSAGVVPPAPMSETVRTIATVSIVVIGFLFTAFMNQLTTRDLRLALKDATYDLVQANRKLEEASKLKSQFTARTSHELRTPLSAIIVFTDLALRKMYGPLNEKQEDSLQRVLLSAKRLNALIEDILDLSKIEAGEIEIYEEALEVSTLVETISSTLEATASEKDLEFAVTLSPDMPATIIGDEKRLNQVLINLTHNAIKFTEKGRVTVSIETVKNSNWRMTVADTGRGIHEEYFESIFDEFRQVSTEGTGAKNKGTGLGLAITRQLVEMMGGSISLKSKLGKGSTFEVTLPLKVPPNAASEKITRSAWQESQSRAG